MFMNPERREAAEIKAEANWKLYHSRKWMVKVPAKLIGVALVLSFTYYAGEAAGVAICAPPILSPK